MRTFHPTVACRDVATLSYEERVDQAVLEIKAGAENKAAVAEKWNVSVSTVKTRCANGFAVGVKKGRPTALSPDKEAIIVDYVKYRNNTGTGINHAQARRICKKFILKYTKQKNVRCSKKLIAGILKRAGDVSFNLPRHTTRGRLTTFNRVSVTKWATLTAEVMEKFRRNPERIFNIDGKYFNMLEMNRGKVRWAVRVPEYSDWFTESARTPLQVLMEKGTKEPRREGADREEHATLMFGIFAEGPPMLTFWNFPGKGIVGVTARAAAEGMDKLGGWVHTETGHMNAASWHVYAESIIIPELKRRGFVDDLGSLLFLDGSNPMDLATRLMLADAGVVVVEFVSNGTGFTQPCDQRFAAIASKAMYLAEEDEVELTDRLIPMYVELAIKALSKTKDQWKKAFESCGMYPCKDWAQQYIKYHDEKGNFEYSDLRLGMARGGPEQVAAEKTAAEILADFKKDSHEYFILRDPKVKNALAKRVQEEDKDAMDVEGKPKGRGQDLTNIFLTGPKVMQLLAEKEEKKGAEAAAKAKRAEDRARVEDAKRIYQATKDATGAGKSTVRAVTDKWVKVGKKDVVHFQVHWWHISAPKDKLNQEFHPYTNFDRADGKFVQEEVEAYATSKKLTKFEKLTAQRGCSRAVCGLDVNKL